MSETALWTHSGQSVHKNMNSGTSSGTSPGTTHLEGRGALSNRKSPTVGVKKVDTEAEQIFVGHLKMWGPLLMTVIPVLGPLLGPALAEGCGKREPGWPPAGPPLVPSPTWVWSLITPL